MHFNSLFLIALVLPVSLLAQKSKYGRESLDQLPVAPDYADLYFWAAHPDQYDSADLVPGTHQLTNNQAIAIADVFFVHPTIYTDDQHPTFPWNADLMDESLNRQVDGSTIKNQASVFNGSARVYAPRYRQAHIEVFYTGDSVIKATALDHAYQDVKAAFEYYLKNWNAGRPLIIASHSQGTLHAARLMKEYINQKDLKLQLVVAYLIGMPLNKELYSGILPCEAAEETGCWISWNTFKKGYFPDRFEVTYAQALSTNPINWRIDETYASRTENMGGVMRHYETILPEVTDAQNYRGVLWAEKPHFPGRLLLTTKRYHIADYNLYYLNIRENVATRVSTFLSQSTGKK